MKIRSHSSSPELFNGIPQHVSIIMDGNGRWASKRRLPRIMGHQRGVEVLHEVIEYANQIGVKYLSAWAFSTANWNRPKEEVLGLMGLLKRTIQKDLVTFHKRNARLRIIGSRENLSDEILTLIDHAEETTKNNTGITIVIFFNYDGKFDIMQAVHRFYQDHPQQKNPPHERDLDPYLLTKAIPEPELVIRSGNLFRFSNYMIWQCAFSEFFFSDKLWPDFKADDLQRAIDHYRSTERKFGKISHMEPELGEKQVLASF